MPFNANCPGCGSLDPCNCGNKPQSNEIKYIGPNLSCTGIQTCDDMSVALQKIDHMICILQAAIFPTTTSTTTNNITSTTTTTTATPTTTTTTTAEPLLSLAFTLFDLPFADAIIGDIYNVSDWNMYFDLPTYGTPFTSVQIIGNTVHLIGATNITIKEELFDQSDKFGTNLFRVDDTAGCITEVEYDGFGYDNYDGCQNIISISLPALTTAGDWAFNYIGRNMPIATINMPLLETAGRFCFYNCESLTTIDLPLLTTAGDYCFASSTLLTTIDLPLLETAGYACFQICTSLTTINFPLLTTAGNRCFRFCYSLATVDLPLCTDLGGSVGDDFVFDQIIGNTITATFNSVLATCDSGNPDGDIQYLSANNTVTITYV